MGREVASAAAGGPLADVAFFAAAFLAFKPTSEMLGSSSSSDSAILRTSCSPGYASMDFEISSAVGPGTPTRTDERPKINVSSVRKGVGRAFPDQQKLSIDLRAYFLLIFC